LAWNTTARVGESFPRGPTGPYVAGVPSVSSQAPAEESTRIAGEDKMIYTRSISVRTEIEALQGFPGVLSLCHDVFGFHWKPKGDIMIQWL